ncbi:Tyrosine recombinase XerC [Candidatus Methanoperedenaceae archaeon GB50]|nr:Tyrosine recombinase XerC [Candidatus Methanoperedenaceae archaeon GB50]
MSITPYQTLPLVGTKPIQYLTEIQTNALVQAFQQWYDKSPTKTKGRIRGRYWLTFLVLRFTGARIGEVLGIDDRTDIDFRNAEIKLVTLKRHNSRRRNSTRIIPVPASVTSEIATYLAEFPEQRGRVFKLDQGNFRRVFYERAKEAAIPKDLAHPHILRHTRAIELLRAGVPVTIVQDLLGHSALTTTAVYLRISGQEAKGILREKGLV